MTKCYLVLAITVLNALTWAELNLRQFCSDKNVNEVFAHPHDCSGYIVCSEEPLVQYCAVGFHFDTKRMVCNWPEDANCRLASEPVNEEVNDLQKTVYTSLMALDIMTGEVIDPMVGYEPLNVVCRHFGAYFLPNPQQCRSYYLCAYGHIHQHSCGPDTLWNYETQQCVLSHKANCYHLSEEEEKEVNEYLISSMQNSSIICYPVNENATTAEAFPPTASIQVRPTASTTTAIPVPPLMTETPTTATTTKPNLANPFNIACPPKRQRYVAHPKDCSKYIMCIMGIPVMTSCPEGLWWDARKEYCDLRQKVQCFQGKNVDTI